jgi:hypothetical protein
MTEQNTQFNSLNALSELPWFDINSEGRLVSIDPEIGHVVDVHTHLSMRYGSYNHCCGGPAPRPTEHYLPIESDFDLDLYANRNLGKKEMKSMKSSLFWGSLMGGFKQATHTADNLKREMAEMGITLSVLLPIELKWLSWNAEAYLDVVEHHDNLCTMGSVHPKGRNVADRLAAQKARGACGIKIHPGVQWVRPDSQESMEIYRLAAELNLPILWHCGPVDIEPIRGRRCCQLKYYWNAVKENPETQFVLGHCGALQFESALELSKEYSNVWLEISCQGLPNIKRIIKEAPLDRVMFGSDWPFYHQALPLAKLLIATEESKTVRRKILSENACSLFQLTLDTEAAIPALKSSA